MTSPDEHPLSGLHSFTGATMPTIEEIDEALFHLSLVPEAERGAGWHASLDARLAQRARLAAPEARRRTTRVLVPAETR